MTCVSTNVAERGLRTRPLTTGDRAFFHFTLQNPGEFLEGGVVLCVDDPTLTLAELRAHVTARLPGAPALTERLFRPVTVAHSPGAVIWRHDDNDTPDLDYHVSVENLRAGSGNSGLRAAMDRIATQPLDLEHPLWRLWLLRGHSPTEVAIVYRFNHIHQDGSAVHQALHLLFGAGPEPAPRTLRTFGAPQARDYARMAAGVFRNLPRTRQLASWAGPPRGAARHTWAVTELERLRRIARREAVTVNDVYLAAVAGALRAWSLPEWLPATVDGSGRPRRALPRRRQRTIHTAMPINVRTPDEQEILSNFTLGIRVPLPCAEADPRRRLAQIAEQTRRIKARGRFGVVERRLLDRMSQDTSPRVFAKIVSTAARPTDTALVTSNLGTMVGPYTVAGRRVTTLIGMAPLLVGRQHLSSALFGLDEQVCAAFTASASVPRHTDLAGNWLAELAAFDVRAQGGPAPAPTGSPRPPVVPVLPGPRTPPPDSPLPSGAAGHAARTSPAPAPRGR
ncbi:wax ester/triacylglycerol synthase domain-containing protein [Parafrankia discariae]|uniref:wax ester/triacylglycerol synthase domain-containing protein n=1 Tax=Parafrankia discariae TaxID=365528 RepID=UPI0003612849|nr:wax ester/triacylglycerol synthase domain-containing protein [Parafrankia discariae]